MERGSRRTSARDVPELVAPAAVDHPVIVAEEAMTELIELLTYIRKDSPQNAAEMRTDIAQRLDRMRTFPLVGHVDENAVSAPPGSKGYSTTVEGIAIYYLFPVQYQSQEVSLVLTIRRGSRMPLDDTSYLARWAEELAKLAPEESPTT